MCSRKQAEQTIVVAEAESRQKYCRSRRVATDHAGRPGRSFGAVEKDSSYGDPRLFALSRVSEQLSHSTQPLVPDGFSFPAATPERFGHEPGTRRNVLNLLVAEKSGFQLADGANRRTCRISRTA